MIKIENVNFGFHKDKQVLRHISFELKKGETLAIVGASGCGKSTLLRIISGILPNSKHNFLTGEINLDGLTPDQYRQSDKLAFMFQEATLLPNLTVKQNVEVPLNIKDQSNPEKVEELINTVGLTEYGSYLPKQLSGGMKTRVALARSFTTNPDLLLLDEPFSALDIAWKSKLYVELEKLINEAASTVVIVTHDVQEALLLADHVIVMNRNGSIEARKEINSGYTIMDRVKDISGYMNSVYEAYMLPIQDAIINGQNRTDEK
ncbi:Sulfate/thiosulfate import ATP-binding protein CysA [compost metagenome]